MRAYKWLLYSGSVMLLTAVLGLVFGSHQALADTSCNSTDCYFTDTTINDFAAGTFYLTGLSNNGDGAVQLVPLGLTANWDGDDNTLPVSRTELAAVIYKDIIYVIGGYDNSGNRIGEVISASTYITGPLKGPWQRNVTTLNPALAGMSAVISTTGQTGGYLYVLGGSQAAQFPASPITNAISYIHFNASGQFDSVWQSGSPLLNQLVYAKAIVHNGYLYVLGGYDGSADNDSIYSALIYSDGHIGSWSELSPLPFPLGLSSEGAVVWSSPSGTDYLYIIGGRPGAASTSGTSETWYASFDDVGALSPFTPTGSLPQGFYAHSAVQGNGQIFVTGGLRGTQIEPVADVNSALINMPDGSLLQLLLSTYWIPSKVLPQPRYKHASVINSGGIVYVIGGTGTSSSPEASGSNTVYRGETSGFGSHYAGTGNYVSRILNLGAPRNISQITVNSTITSSVTMTVQYRYANTVADLIAATWTAFPDGLNTGVNVSTARAVNINASLMQYQVFFTGTNSIMSTLTPVLNSFQVQYPPPPTLPDFAITRLDAPPAFTSPVTQTQVITYWVSNKAALFAPERRTQNIVTSPKAPTKTTGGLRVPPPPALGKSPGKVAAPQDNPPTYMFWVSFYADPNPAPTTPISVTNAMTCIDVSPSHVGLPGGPYSPFIYYNLELYKTPSPFYAQCDVPANKKNFYAQIDTCNISTDADCTTNGYVLESDEKSNPPYYGDNIIGPVAAGTSGSNNNGGAGLILYLPLVKR